MPMFLSLRNQLFSPFRQNKTASKEAVHVMPVAHESPAALVLPPEIWLQIVDFMTPSELRNLALLSRVSLWAALKSQYRTARASVGDCRYVFNQFARIMVTEAQMRCALNVDVSFTRLNLFIGVQQSYFCSPPRPYHPPCN